MDERENVTESLFGPEGKKNILFHNLINRPQLIYKCISADMDKLMTRSFRKTIEDHLIHSRTQ